MKKLSKLKLQDAKVMNDFEMKHVVGGYGTENSGTTCSYTCGGKTETIPCYGDCKELTGGEVGVKCVESGKDKGFIRCVSNGY